MSNNLVSFAAWSFLPNHVTSWVQSLYYSITIRTGSPRPRPGTPRHERHRRIIHILVVSTYLIYTIYEADYEIRRAPDFYTVLGVSHSATDRDIKSRFRRLAATYHPDKLASASSADSNGYFVHLKLAQDTLLNPAKRFAYERFGPEILNWQRCSSIRDYCLQGVQGILPYYGAAAVFMYILGFLGYLEWGKYWRFLTLLILCVFELHAISRPYFPVMGTKLINPLLTTFTNHPPYLPYQLIQLFRKMSVTFYIALSQIGPLIQPRSPAQPGKSPEDALQEQLNLLEMMVNGSDMDAMRLLEIEMTPFSDNPQALNQLKGKAKEWLVQNTVRNDPLVRDAIAGAVRRSRQGAGEAGRGMGRSR